MNENQDKAIALENWINDRIYPNSFYDGGYITFESFDGKTLTLGAYQEHSNNPAGNERMGKWIALQVKKMFDIQIDVAYNCYVPYYK